jgi:mannose-6-phosphate isomerase-like protein (cupin superfamily)
MRRVVLLTALFSVPLLAAFAQTDVPVLVTKAEIQQHKDALLKKAAADPHGFASEQLRRDAGHYVLLVGRTKTGEAEEHAEWGDEMVVQEGKVTVVVGGTMDGKYEQATKGEFRGTGVTGGKEYPLGPGEMMYIPAGIPHWVKVQGTEPMFMFVYKVK